MSQHAAPALTYPVGPAPLAAAVMALLWLLAAAMTGLWALMAADPWTACAGLIVCLLSGLAMARHRGPRGDLVWDGQLWLWCSRAYPAGTEVERPQIVLDAQVLIVARMRNRAGASWVLCLQSRGDRRAWLDLRRALYARAPSQMQASDARPVP